MKHRDGMLDLARGLSALLVMLSHLRGMIFRDLVELDHPTPLIKAFYFATGLGHQAVMVFLVNLLSPTGCQPPSKRVRSKRGRSSWPPP